MMLVVLVVVMVILALILAGSMIFLAAASRNEVPAVFTPGKSLAQVVEALDLPEHGKVVDLGCGDGRVLEAVLRRQPHLVAVGVENNPVVLVPAKVRLGKRAKLRRSDLRKFDLRGCDRVFVYLGPGMMASLEPKFERQLGSGARVVSQQFPLPHRKPDQVIDLARGKPYAKRLYVYDY